MIAPPTWEEAPISFNAWRKQRMRWIKGHMQTWLVLMRQPFKALRDMGLLAFLSVHLVLGGGIVAALVHLPLALMLFIAAASPLDLLAPADFILALCGYCVAAFAALNASALTGNFSPLKAAPMMPLYWPLASLAAYDAVKELFLRPHHWAKTAHGVSPRPKQARDTPHPAPVMQQRATG